MKKRQRIIIWTLVLIIGIFLGGSQVVAAGTDGITVTVDGNSLIESEKLVDGNSLKELEKLKEKLKVPDMLPGESFTRTIEITNAKNVGIDLKLNIYHGASSGKITPDKVKLEVAGIPVKAENKIPEAMLQNEDATIKEIDLGKLSSKGKLTITVKFTMDSSLTNADFAESSMIENQWEFIATDIQDSGGGGQSGGNNGNNSGGENNNSGSGNNSGGSNNNGNNSGGSNNGGNSNSGGGSSNGGNNVVDPGGNNTSNGSPQTPADNSNANNATDTNNATDKSKVGNAGLLSGRLPQTAEEWRAAAYQMIVGIALVAAVFVIWKKRQRKIGNETQKRGETK